MKRFITSGDWAKELEGKCRYMGEDGVEHTGNEKCIQDEAAKMKRKTHILEAEMEDLAAKVSRNSKQLDAVDMCSVAYRQTGDKKVFDLPVKESEQVKSCVALDLYPNGSTVELEISYFEGNYSCRFTEGRPPQNIVETDGSADLCHELLFGASYLAKHSLAGWLTR